VVGRREHGRQALRKGQHLGRTERRRQRHARGPDGASRLASAGLRGRFRCRRLMGVRATAARRLAFAGGRFATFRTVAVVATSGGNYCGMGAAPTRGRCPCDRRRFTSGLLASMRLWRRRWRGRGNVLRRTWGRCLVLGDLMVAVCLRAIAFSLAGAASSPQRRARLDAAYALLRPCRACAPIRDLA